MTISYWAFSAGGSLLTLDYFPLSLVHVLLEDHLLYEETSVTHSLSRC